MTPVAATRPFVFRAMGTVVSVIAADELPGDVHTQLQDVFERLEERFSLYRRDSEASRVARRELLVPHASAEYRLVYDEAIGWRSATGGAFTPHRPDGVIDLSGIVKALAIRDAGVVLTSAGLADWCINAGGDVLTRGHQADGRPWVVGIVDPDDRSSLLSQVTCPDAPRAVCTSGTAERGEHVWRTGADATFTQVTVAAGDVVTADVLATAILAGGPDSLRRAEEGWDIEVLACAADGRCWATPALIGGDQTEPA